MLDHKYFEMVQSFDFKFLNSTSASNFAELNQITASSNSYSNNLTKKSSVLISQQNKWIPLADLSVDAIANGINVAIT
ncbi:MAG: hypothetical protein EZS28_007682 [Streblomastix strix]|uniref:Uncharacterized protein n=1 Tax=Streblomastix strix TaxID=222440 RepID=A0A5J4WRT1_9EUKA|nr:MAG: hypothetical protein EZS28_007682 [Streblomastix strix]